jgi:class 3 adenylate cyclase/tetratricopeptide (TPR) repeat protein
MEAERRQVTVLFADMVGFTSFSERSGEEAAYTLMRSLSKLMDEAVREQGGVVQSFTGDGIMAVFGAPVALEDAPLRACRAALSILQRLNAARLDLEAKHGVVPQLRIGINTGAAVIGKVQEGAEAQVTVLGDTVNFASRLQSLAEPNAVFLSEATHRLVRGQVDVNFAGEHAVKGKSEPQRIYSLAAIRKGTTRFEAAVSRGLSVFVGRKHELEVLDRALGEACSKLGIIDIVAEPGMGKSRLLHEFRQRIGKDRAFVLSGSCSPDGQQTAFMPFIEVVRGSFRVSAGEAEGDIAQKLELGLTTLGLQSSHNVALLLHLLGIKVPDGALIGLDGVLIGLRTRELLQELLVARCRLSAVVLMIEDLHWIDGASEELLGKIVNSETNLRLLLLTTHRPEYSPPWLARAVVSKLPLEPLPLGDIRRLIGARLGAEGMPQPLEWQIAEKADGNPLFAEEIVSFLSERGMVRTTAGNLDLDATAVATALPASVQGLLTARVDRLANNDRVLLQAASVIGRRFDEELLAAVVGEIDINARLTAMQALDLIRPEGESGEFAFKHALVRDALYESLLTDARKSLHLKIAEEIERRTGNRLTEVAEVLAHHYSQTTCPDKAFFYLSVAGSKSLGVYSLDEATTHFGAALALLDNSPDSASDDQIAEFLVSYAALLNMSVQIDAVIDVLGRYLSRIDRLGDDSRVVLIRHHYVIALLWNTRYREAAAIQQETSPRAERVGDSRSRAYSLAIEILVSTIVAPKPLDQFEKLKKEAIKAASDTTDAYIQNWTRWVIGWEEFHRGRITHARVSAHELIQVGRTLSDPRSTGLGLALLTWIALVSDSYAEACEYSEQSLAVAVTPLDRSYALNGMGDALVLLRRIEDGLKVLQDNNRHNVDGGLLYTLAGSEGVMAIGRVLQGNIGEGIRLLEEAISRREKEGYRVAADWYRLFLVEIYIQIMSGNEKLAPLALMRNMPVILKVMIIASSRIPAVMKSVFNNPHFHPDGHFIGRGQMLLGLFYKAKKKHPLALEHLTVAKRILSQFGQSPLLARLETALAELGQ